MQTYEVAAIIAAIIREVSGGYTHELAVKEAQKYIAVAREIVGAD